MGSEQVTEGGEVVYLLAELRSHELGPVYEIGSRARVLEADDDRLTLAVGYGRFESIVTCSHAQVSRQRRSLATRRALRADRWSAA
jgi:hypothetical protein